MQNQTQKQTNEEPEIDYNEYMLRKVREKYGHLLRSRQQIPEIRPDERPRVRQLMQHIADNYKPFCERKLGRRFHKFQAQEIYSVFVSPVTYFFLEIEVDDGEYIHMRVDYVQNENNEGQWHFHGCVDGKDAHDMVVWFH